MAQNKASWLFLSRNSWKFLAIFCRFWKETDAPLSFRWTFCREIVIWFSPINLPAGAFLGGVMKTFRPPLTSLLPLALEFVAILVFSVLFFDANDWREFLPGDNSGILDYALLGIAMLIPLYFVYGAVTKLYSRITVERDAFVLHRLFGVFQLCKFFGVTRIPFKNIAAIHVQKNEADLLVPFFSIFGRERCLFDLGFGCLVFVLKEDDDEYMEGFTPKIADELRKILENFEKENFRKD